MAAAADVLEAHGITHVLNCAGCSVPDYHADKFTYLTIHVLDDGHREEISCFLHAAIEFIEEAW